MDPYITFRRVEHDLDTLSFRAGDFLQKCTQELKGLDLSKIEILNPTEVRDKLLELKGLAQQLLKIIDATLDGGQYTRGLRRGAPEAMYVHGRLGQLKGKYQPLKNKLNAMQAHLDILASAAAANNSQAQTMVALSELKEVSGDMAKKFGKDGAYLETVGAVLVMIGIIHLIVKKFK